MLPEEGHSEVREKLDALSCGAFRAVNAAGRFGLGVCLSPT